MEGKVADDAAFPRLRSNFEAMVLRQMRDKGYVPVLDLGPFWSTEYVKTNKSYNFKLSLFGIYVGRRRAWEVDGIMNGREIPRSIHQTKSLPFSGI